MELLASRGHQLAVLFQELDDRTTWMFRGAQNVAIHTITSARTDEWSDASELVRYLRDYVQYLDMPYRGATKLRRRVFERLVKRVFGANPPAGWNEDFLLQMPDLSREQLRSALAVLERAIPTDPTHDRLLAQIAPNAVLVSPLVHFGSAQVEVVKSARARKVPVGMLLSSWDNLSTKGALHSPPDRLYVWNNQQRQEAAMLHDFPADQVTVVGAPRFDSFYGMQSRVGGDEFREPFGVADDAIVLLYLCSSRLVSEKEVNFIRSWTEAIRASNDPRLRESLLLVRPHPDLPWPDARWLGERRTFQWPSLGRADLQARVLFRDPRALLVSSDIKQGPAVLFEQIFHSRAVVGLNTSAEIEAGIVGRPVFTIDAPTDIADGQATTLHFHYLTEEHGGFVKRAATLEAHVAQLSAELVTPRSEVEIRTHVERFVRPLGAATPASEVLAAALEDLLVPTSQSVEAVGAVGDTAPASDHQTFDGREEGMRRLDWRGITMWFRGAGRGALWSDGVADSLAQLVQQLTVNDVLYDLSPGVGITTIAASKAARCTVVAFEPNFATLAALWQNVLFNRCDGSVVPVAVRLSTRAELVGERYASFAPGAARMSARPKRWRPHEAIAGEGLVQPAMTLPVAALKSWKLPQPTAVFAALDSVDEEVQAVVDALKAEFSIRLIAVEAAPA